MAIIPLLSLFALSCNAKPNFIIFYIDDLLYTTNWAESYVKGTKLSDNKKVTYYDIPTPNINKIRNEGAIFPRSYAASVVCAPSRFSIITGRNAARSKWAIKMEDGHSPFGPDITVDHTKLYGYDLQYNIPSFLQGQSYQTAMIGKWHLMIDYDEEDANIGWKCQLMGNGKFSGNAEVTTPPKYPPQFDTTPFAVYDDCRNKVKEAGFDTVEAFYHGNIPTFEVQEMDPVEDGKGWLKDDRYTHNPEWMVKAAQDFIDGIIEDGEQTSPFFMYFATTLTHDPNMYISLKKGVIRMTPKGLLTSDEVTPKGMDSRKLILENVHKELGETDTGDGWYDAQKGKGGLQTKANWYAGTMWLDNAIGAVINYLQKEDEPVRDENGDVMTDLGNHIIRKGNGKLDMLDNTFILIMNDHGMPAKGGFYEHGSRVVQFIRYPPLFPYENRYEQYITSNNFITSNIDIAPVIFQLAVEDGVDYKEELENYGIADDGYILDGKSWIDEVMDHLSSPIDEKETSGSSNCCTERFIDVDHSHAIVTSTWKYIYRETKDNKPTGCYGYAGCEGCSDLDSTTRCSPSDTEGYPKEELYNMKQDKAEQTNLIHEDSKNIKRVAEEFRDSMKTYIEEQACYFIEGMKEDPTACWPVSAAEKGPQLMDIPWGLSSSSSSSSSSPSTATTGTWIYAILTHILILILICIIMGMCVYMNRYKVQMEQQQKIVYDL